MQTEYDDNVLDYWKLPNGNYNVKFQKDDGLDGNSDVKNTSLCHLGSIILNTTGLIIYQFSIRTLIACKWRKNIRMC